MSRYQVRNFWAGDEAKIARLFNQVYKEYGGFVPRTVKYWRWCCLKRPDVEENGVFLVTEKPNDDVVGYVVAGSSGSLWEFVVGAGGDRKEIASILLREALKYLEGLGVSSANVNVPKDNLFGEVFAEAGFSEISSERMFVSALNVKKLFSVLVTDAMFAEDFDEDIVIELERSPLGVDKVFSVKIHNSQVKVEDGRLARASMLVKMDFLSLLSVLFEDASGYSIFFRGKVSIKPFWKTRRFLNFLSSMRVKAPWFFPLSDFG